MGRARLDSRRKKAKKGVRVLERREGIVELLSRRFRRLRGSEDG